MNQGIFKAEEDILTYGINKSIWTLGYLNYRILEQLHFCCAVGYLIDEQKDILKNGIFTLQLTTIKGFDLRATT